VTGPVTATTGKEKANEARNRGRGMSETQVIHPPDQRLRVFVSSTIEELAAERRAVRAAVTRLRLVPTMFELGARSHPPREVYRAYLAQSQVFVAVYWQSYGWVAPGEQVSGLEDEYRLSAGLPRLIYVKSPAEDRDPRLARMLDRITEEGGVSYQNFSEPAELQRLVENDLAVLLSERFTVAGTQGEAAAGDEMRLGDELPVPPTPLVGREEAVAAVEALVSHEGVRLITLTGPGGSGKSRLALEAAGRLRPGFGDGVRLIDLASVPSADLVPGAIAAGLGLNTSGTRIGTDLVSYLRSRRVLLVLDNFEQVTGAAPLLAQLLAAAPGVVLLVTSRSVLRLSGEHEFPVLPLPAPPAGAASDAGLHGRYPSVRLFVDRAQAVAPEFTLTDQNAGTVAEICRRLDGLPLAIELAAARVKLLPPRALLARLGGRMSVLTGGPRDLPERQRTLKNTLDWSFALLSPSERELFERLGVFAGTFSLPAVEAVYGEAGAPGRADSAGLAIDALSSLAGSSLVQSQTRGEEPRFRLLETIREYALERLRDSGAWQEAHDRHAAYFEGLAAPAESELGGEGQLAWLSRLETEGGNLSAVMSWLMDQDRLDEAIAFIWGTWRFWFLHGHLNDIARYADKFLARSGEMALHARAMALSGSGFTLIAYGDQDRGQSAFEQSLPLYREAGDPLGGALAAAALGHLLSARNDLKRGGELLEYAMSLLREADTGELTAEERLYHQLDVAVVDNFLGQIELGNGEHDRAAQLFAAGLDAARTTADWFPVLVSLYDLALSSQARGDLEGTAELLREGLSLAAEAGDEPSAAYYLEALATLARLRDDPERAAILLAAADAQLQTSGSGWLHAYVPRAPHDAGILAELRSRLGDAAYEQAAADGRSLSGTRALQYGLQDAQPGQERRKIAA
jgi:predicted ATPase